MNYWFPWRKEHVDFRVLAAARGGVAPTTPTNFGTVSLFNNNPASYFLILRAWQWGAVASASWGVGYTQSRLTGTPGVVTPLVAGEATPPGLVDYSDQAAALAVDWTSPALPSSFSALWTLDIAFAALRPGWSIYFTQLTTAKVTGAGFIWEFRAPDDL